MQFLELEDGVLIVAVMRHVGAPRAVIGILSISDVQGEVKRRTAFSTSETCLNLSGEE